MGMLVLMRVTVGLITVTVCVGMLVIMLMTECGAAAAGCAHIGCSFVTDLFLRNRGNHHTLPGAA
jgi:hypothetical protein